MASLRPAGVALAMCSLLAFACATWFEEVRNSPGDAIAVGCGW